MSKTLIAKRIVSGVVAIGTTKIIHGIISSTTDPESATDKVAIFASSVVLGSMAKDLTKKYTDAKIDAAIAWYKTVQNKIDAK